MNGIRAKMIKKPKEIIDLSASVAILTLCILLGVSMVIHRTWNIADILSTGTGADNLKGAQLPALPDYSWAAHPETLVLAIRKGCHFCEDSLPFYKRLSDLEINHKLGAHILIVTPDDKLTVQNMLSPSGISADSSTNELLSNLRVSATPTVMLVDRRGRVQKFWEGQQPAEGENEIIQAAN